MWAKRLLPSSLAGRFVKKPVDESDASKAEPVPVPEAPVAVERARSSTPKRRNDASPSARKTQGDTDEKSFRPPTCPRAFKMITFRTPCGCESCDPFQELAERRALPTFGRSPESPRARALPTFGRSPSGSSLPRSASARSLSPRRPRDEEVVPCDWSSLHSLVGQLGVVQSQVLRKLRDDQEEQLLLQSAMQTQSASSPSGSSGYQAKKDVWELKGGSLSPSAESPTNPSTTSPRGARPRAASRSASVKPLEPAVDGKKKSVRPRSAAPKSREAQAPKAKAKAKGKSKAKSKGPADREEPPACKVPAVCRCHEMMWTLEGQEIRLENCQKVEELLQDLHLSVANPLCHHFRLRYDFLLEQHCQERKAGVARRAPKLVQGEERYLTTVRLRVRKHPAKGDPQKEFIGRGAMMAVLLHELAHLRYMNHGAEFMLLLRDIFAEAKHRGIFDPELVNELPSCRPWENLIYQTGGNIDEATLMKLFEPDGSSCATPRSQSPVRARPKVEVESPAATKEAVKAGKGKLPDPPDLSEPRPSGASGASTAAASGRDSLETTPSLPEPPDGAGGVQLASEKVEEAVPGAAMASGGDSPTKARKSRVLRPRAER